jgi:hypothetical protein
MKYQSQNLYRKKNRLIRFAETNLGFLSLKSSLRLLTTRPKNFQKLDMPLLIISGMQRSGNHLIDYLLRNHHQILSFYRELQIGKPNKYYWPNLKDKNTALSRFKTLIPRNMVKHFLSFNRHENFFFDFKYFKKVFLEAEKQNKYLNQRESLNNFFTAYYAAYLNCNHSNFFDEYRYIAVPIPGLPIYKESISRFFADYPDGKIIVSIREPYFWWNSARNHSERQRKYGLERYQRILQNSIQACQTYKDQYFILSFDNLVKDTKNSVKSILSSIFIDDNPISYYPSNFPNYAIDNSTFGHKETKSVIKEKVKRELTISDDDRRHIAKNIFPIYDEVLNQYAINL